MRILWVEDEYTKEMERIHFDKIIREEHHQVKIINNFDDIEAEINKNLYNYDLIALDINLEKFDLNNTIRKKSNFFGIPIDDYVKKAGYDLFMAIMNQGFPEGRVLFLTGNADDRDSRWSLVKRFRLAIYNKDIYKFNLLSSAIHSSLDEDEEKNFADICDTHKDDQEKLREKILEYLENIAEQPTVLNTYDSFFKVFLMLALFHQKQLQKIVRKPKIHY